MRDTVGVTGFKKFKTRGVKQITDDFYTDLSQVFYRSLFFKSLSMLQNTIEVTKDHFQSSLF